jgi:polysaccharide pyruvyl transferase WcaK-like protein
MDRWPEATDAEAGRRERAVIASAETEDDRPEIAIFGEWNTANLGERAIHGEVRRFFDGCGWRVTSFGLGSLSAWTPDGAEARSESRRFGLGAAVDRLSPGTKRAVCAVRQRIRMQRLLPRLERVHAISVGGGALLCDDNLHFPQSLMELARGARLLNKPLLCMGCSAEGAWSGTGAPMIREFLEACTLIAVRDEATAERVAGLVGAVPPVFGDFCLSEQHVLSGGERSPGRHDIGINVCQLSGPWASAQQDYEDRLVSLVNRLARRMAGPGRGIRIFTTGVPADACAAERVFARLEATAAELYLPRNVAQLSSMLRTTAAVVASRLHGAVLPLAEGVPVVGFTPTPKLGNFFSTMGIKRYCHGVGAAAELAEWVADADPEAWFAEQRRALVHSRVWALRAEVRAELASVAQRTPDRHGREARCA